MKYLVLILSLLALNAHAYTECTVNIDKIHAGDAGHIYIFYVGGGSVMIQPTDVNQKNALSLALAAFMANKKVIVRYNSDGVSCTASLVNDFRGLWILKT